MKLGAHIYNAFDAEVPLSGDDRRYVDLSAVRGNLQVAKRIAQRIQNMKKQNSYHLVMGHTKCGKTTEINRTIKELEYSNFITVNFDAADHLTRNFEYTTLLLLLVSQTINQLGQHRDRGVRPSGKCAARLAELLRAQEITVSNTAEGDASGKLTAGAAKGMLTRLFGDFGLEAELRGGFRRTREVTTKLEADTRAFLAAVREVIEQCELQCRRAGYSGLVIVCDGMEKLEIRAMDGSGIPHELQVDMFVNHAADLQSIPCHVVFTVPISVPANLGDLWEANCEFVPSIPVSKSEGVTEDSATKGREALKKVIEERLRQIHTTVNDLFLEPRDLDLLIDASGGHISDLLLLVREAVLLAQTDDAEHITSGHAQTSIAFRMREYQRLIEPKHMKTLADIEQLQAATNDDVYRDMIFKRLVLEYVVGNRNVVDLHPLVAASQPYRAWKGGRRD